MDELDAELEAIFGPPPPPDYIDPRDITNGAWRSSDGRFYELPERRRPRHRDPMFFGALASDVRRLFRFAEGRNPEIALRAIKTLRTKLDELEHEAVELALASNWAWRDIGDALGLSRSAAHARFTRRAASTASTRGSRAARTRRDARPT